MSIASRLAKLEQQRPVNHAAEVHQVMSVVLGHIGVFDAATAWVDHCAANGPAARADALAAEFEHQYQRHASEH